MPLYTDSKIVGIPVPKGGIKAVIDHYNHEAIQATENERPNNIFNVWVVKAADADLLVRYRGEYRLGIIVGGLKSPATRSGDMPKALEGRLTMPKSMATHHLVRYRSKLVMVEQWAESKDWMSLDQLCDYTHFLFPMQKSGAEASLSDDDITALATFVPYLDMVKRAFAVMAAFFGLSLKESELKVLDNEQFLRFFANGGDGVRKGGEKHYNYRRITRMLVHLRQMCSLGSTVLLKEYTALKTLVGSTMKTGIVPADTVKVWTEEIKKE